MAEHSDIKFSIAYSGFSSSTGLLSNLCIFRCFKVKRRVYVETARKKSWGKSLHSNGKSACFVLNHQPCLSVTMEMAWLFHSILCHLHSCNKSFGRVPVMSLLLIPSPSFTNTTEETVFFSLCLELSLLKCHIIAVFKNISVSASWDCLKLKGLRLIL